MSIKPVRKEICVTSGEILPDGRVLDLLRRGKNDQLQLVLSTPKAITIVSEFKLGDELTYRPAQLNASYSQAIRFPAEVKEYGKLTSVAKKLADLAVARFGFSQLAANTISVWVITTWVPEVFNAPPTLRVCGRSVADAVELFRLLASVARRGLIVADLAIGFSVAWNPTLLLLDPELSKRTRGIWQNSNHRGVYVPGPNGALRQFICSKAVYTSTDDAELESLQVTLLPCDELPALSESDLNEIAEEFQPQLQLFRLRTLPLDRTLPSNQIPKELDRSRLGRELYTMVRDDGFANTYLKPIVDQIQRLRTIRISTDPLAAIVEATWAPAHNPKRTPMRMAEIHQRVNALLQGRGERLEYSIKELGWKCSQAGLDRHRTADGMILKFSAEFCARLHQLARQFGLVLPKQRECKDCGQF